MNTEFNSWTRGAKISLSSLLWFSKVFCHTGKEQINTVTTKSNLQLYFMKIEIRLHFQKVHHFEAYTKYRK